MAINWSNTIKELFTSTKYVFLNLTEGSRNPVDAVENLCFSPDGHVLAASWVGGGLAVWSVFGSLLFCTLDSTLPG